MQSIKLHIAIFGMLILCAVGPVSGQDSSEVNLEDLPEFVENKGMTLALDGRDFIASHGQLIANNLRLGNKTDKPRQVSIQMNAPEGWRSFGLNKTIEVPPNGTRFVPLRILPGKLYGNTRFLINVIVYDDGGIPLLSDFFYVSSEKIVDWSVAIEPGEKVYFKNGQKTASFSTNILNKGNFSQDLILSVIGTRKDVLLKNTDGRIVENPKYDLSLESKEDTTLEFEIETTREQRNFRSVSLQSHKPYVESEEKVYSLFVNTAESKSSGDYIQKRGNKVQFVRLANEKKVEPYTGPNLPLILEANVQNVLTNNTFMSMVGRGFKTFKDRSLLTYFSQLTFSTNYASQRILQTGSFYAGYFNKNYTAEIGNVSSGIIGVPASGNGVKGSYRVIGDHWVGAFYIKNPRLFGPTTRESFGATYRYSGKGFLRGEVSMGRSQDYYVRRNADVISARGRIRLARSQSLSLIGALSSRRSTQVGNTDPARQGYLVGANYSGRFFNSRLATNIGGRYQSPSFGLSTNERTMVNSRIRYSLTKKQSIFLNSNYSENRFIVRRAAGNAIGLNMIFYNQLVFSNTTKVGSVQPFAYMNMTSILGQRIHSRGVGFRYSNYLFSKNILWGLNSQGGYDRAIFAQPLPDYFVFRFNAMVRVRTFTFMSGYFYGPTSANAVEQMIDTDVNPQYVRTSINHQYLFKNTHFLMRNSLNHTFQNTTKNHRLGYFPEFYYFTDNGWRFSVNLNLSISVKNNEAAELLSPYPTFSTQDDPLQQNEDLYTTTQNTVLGASIRKEFGVPIPFTKKVNFTKEFLAFYDINGDGVKNNSEPILENVVIRLGTYEVLTNKVGYAALLNVPSKKYHFMAYSLENLEGWFPNTPDSLLISDDGLQYVPFVKGVKVYGKVNLDRQKIAITNDKKFDLGNIKISASNERSSEATLTAFDGSFEFYLPNGSYNISMDESILGGKYMLVQNHIPVTLSKEMEGVFVSFLIVEKRRSVKTKKFGSKSNAFGDDSEEQSGAVEGSENLNDVDDKPAPFGGEERPSEDETDANDSTQTDEPRGEDDLRDADNEQGMESTPETDDLTNPEDSLDANQDVPTVDNPADEGGGQDADTPPFDNESAENDEADGLPPFDPSKLSPDELNRGDLSFRINLGEYRGTMPTEVLNKMINAGYTTEDEPVDGKIQFLSPKFNSLEEVEAYRETLRQAGFDNPPPPIVGDYSGKLIDEAAARTILDKVGP